MKSLLLTADLRDYQSAFFVDAMKTLDEGHPGRWLYAAPTGSGKSIMELYLHSFLPDAVLVTPRLEIVAGMLDKGGVDTRGWSADRLAAEALEYRITTPIRLRNMLAAGTLPWRPTCVIWDECFPAGTIVDGRPIETLRVGDVVTAVDEATQRPVHRCVTRLYRNLAPDVLVRVRAGGRAVICTEGHPFYTQRGWVCAYNLTDADCVLLDLSVSVHSGAAPGQVLLPVVPRDRDAGEAFGCNGGHEPPVRVGPDDRAQPDDATRRPREDFSHAPGDGPQAAGAGRERSRPDDAGVAACRGDGVVAVRGADGTPAGRAADALQTGSGRPVGEAGNRSGREQPQDDEGEGGGRQERSVLAWVRVDRVEVHECGSAGGPCCLCPDGHVYNIEVEDVHTYIANGFVVHNCHHTSADSYQDIRAYLGDGIAEIGLTATPFRGTPKGTEDFLASWDSLTWVLTYPDAAARGVIAVPGCSVWPLVDDDEIEVTNGEFVVRATDDATRSCFDEVVSRCQQYRRVRTLPNYSGHDVAYPSWDRATLFSVSTTDAARQLANLLTASGLPAAAVTQDTPRGDRQRLFAECEAAEIALVQIDVISEGVDLKLRRLIDLRPTLSPVKWLQQVGRVTRPSAEPPEYICCNRNLERHGYLFDGLIPPKAIAAAQQAFERPSRRAGARAVGVENIGRFSAAELPLADGTTGVMYQLVTVENFTKREYAVLLHPCSSQPLYASRENVNDGGHVKYGRWQAVDKLPDMRGFQSAPAKTLSEKQAAWWSRAAGAFGLDASAQVTRRNFAALPVLSDLGVRLRA